MIARMERALLGSGVARGDAVAVLCSNHPEGWMAEQAAIDVGARLVPLRPLSGLDDHAFICEDAAVKMLVFEARAFVTLVGMVDDVESRRLRRVEARLLGELGVALGRSPVRAVAVRLPEI